MENIKNYIILKPSGRLGNSFFRYFAYIIFKLKIDKYNSSEKKHEYEYISENEYDKTNDFIFYKGLDLVGHDIDFSQSSLDDMKNIAFLNNNIKCFNTLGFFKDTFNIKMLSSNQYINDTNNNGLYVKNYIIINDSNFEYYFDNIDQLINKNIYLDGFFQKDYIYLKFKNEIMNHIEKYDNIHYLYEDNYYEDVNRKYLLKDFIEDKNILNEKIYNFVIHIRLGDFNNRADFIEFEWYEKILNIIKDDNPELLSFNNALIFDKIDNKKDTEYIDKCINWFNKNNINIKCESNDMLTDFHIIKNAKTVICSMSTFAWSSVYLSKTVQLCYMPNYNFLMYSNSPSFKHPIKNTILYNVKTTPHFIEKMKVVILTLKEENYSRLEELQELIINLNKIGLEIEIYYGINGKDIKIYPTEYETIKLLYNQFKTIFYNTKKRINGELMKNGELGCAWSQLNIYHKLIEDTNYDKYLILEDDAYLLKELSELYELLLNLPLDFDICHIALSDWNPFEKINKINDFFYKIKHNYFNRNTAYILTKSGAKKILQYTENKINVPADDLLCHTYLNTSGFNLYVPEMPYFHIRKNNKSVINMIYSNKYDL